MPTATEGRTGFGFQMISGILCNCFTNCLVSYGFMKDLEVSCFAELIGTEIQELY